MSELPPVLAAAASRRRRAAPLATVFTPPAVILGGTANALSVARSLHHAGVKVYAVGSRSSPVRTSRACAVFTDLGTGAEVQRRWLEWLASDGPHGAVLLPCNDDGLEMIARDRAALVGLGYVPFEVDDAVALDMLDKARTYALARSIGVESPRTLTVRSLVDVRAVRELIGYPCALKPLHSHVFQRHAGARRKAFIVHDETELSARFAEMDALGVEMLATEIIPGPDAQIFGYYTYITADGEPLFHFTKRKLRQYPVGFGTGSYHVTGWEPEVAERGLAFVRGVGVRGLANVEFKRDARDGQLKLIECNHRFTAPTELLRMSGVDLPLLVYDQLRGRRPSFPASYRDGVRLWHPVEDLRAFRQLRRAGDLTLTGWLVSVTRPHRTPLFHWTDPQPAVRDNVRRAKGLLAK